MHRNPFLFKPPPRKEALLVGNHSLRGSPAPFLTHVLEWKSSSVWIIPFLKESCWLEPFWTGSPVKLQCFLTCCISPTMQGKPCTVWKPSDKGNPVLSTAVSTTEVHSWENDAARLLWSSDDAAFQACSRSSYHARRYGMHSTASITGQIQLPTFLISSIAGQEVGPRHFSNLWSYLWSPPPPNPAEIFLLYLSPGGCFSG